MRVRINLAKSDKLDIQALTLLIKENKAAVSFFTSNNVEDNYLFEIEDDGLITRGKSEVLLFESLGFKPERKSILKG